MPCMACGSAPPSVLHHKTGAGMGLRAHDQDGMPLCDPCHKSIHSLTFGHFKGWTKDRRRNWQEWAVGLLQGEYLSEKMGEAPQGAEGVF